MTRLDDGERQLIGEVIRYAAVVIAQLGDTQTCDATALQRSISDMPSRLLDKLGLLGQLPIEATVRHPR